jgi:hypothetical protein
MAFKRQKKRSRWRAIILFLTPLITIAALVYNRDTLAMEYIFHPRALSGARNCDRREVFHRSQHLIAAKFAAFFHLLLIS